MLALLLIPLAWLLSQFMAGFSDYAENKILDHVFGGPSWSAVPATLYMALTTVAVTDSDTGSTLTEASYTGYGRASIATGDWRASSSGSKKNLNPISFAQCTAGSSVVIGFAITDASSAGNVVMFGTVPSTTVTTNLTPQFAQDGVVLTQD